MRSFNPYATNGSARRTSNPRPNAFTAERSRLGRFPAPNCEPPIELAAVGVESHAEDTFDDFDRALLAQASGQVQRSPTEATPLTVSPFNNQCYEQYAVGARDSGSRTYHVKATSSSPSDANPFSSPTVTSLHNRQRSSGTNRIQTPQGGALSRALTLQREGVSGGPDQIACPTPEHHCPQPTSVRGIQLVPTSQLPGKQRTLFNFSLFNAVQSKCFPTAYESDDNLVVSAPTGSGKTAIMELGILRLVELLRNGQAKAVYQAPTKSLCSERHRDWEAKFGMFDIRCAELTGDTDYNTLRHVATASIIITTPEKWDSVTRKWRDNSKLMKMVRLFLVDEVHILKDSRGATLEAIVSRMKSVGGNIRFIALSATIPNSEDIATWLTRSEQARHLPAVREVFNDSFRPVQLRKHVLGHDGPYNPWAFDAALTEKIPKIVAQYGKRKPVIVFCPTKEWTQKTAECLALSRRDDPQAWETPRQGVTVKNELLQKTLSAGVAFHHASLTRADRQAVENGFLRGNIAVICSTSTLAVGVNLPCYLAILKGTQTYTDAGLQEYSSLEVTQMLGRAGRPQFEREACAVILCLNDRQKKYEKMVAGEEVLESSLHHNLIEHLNAEIGTGSVDSMASAKRWLTGTFLNVRLQQNPEYYKCDPDQASETPDQTLSTWCEKGLNLLFEANLVKDTGSLKCTAFGEAMARYCVKLDTMKTLMGAPAKARVSDVLGYLSQAVEFREHRLKQGEKGFYKDLNKANEIRYPIPVDIALPQHKIALVIQAKLGCFVVPKDARSTKFNRSLWRQFEIDTIGVMGYAKRLIRRMVDIFIQQSDSFAVKSALELARSLAAGVWDDTVMQLKQIPGIGDVSLRKLAAANIKSIDVPSNTEPHRLEVILSKNSPFGTDLLKKIADFPMLHVSAKVSETKHKPDVGAVVKLSCQVGFLNDFASGKFNQKPYNVLFLCETSCGEVIDFRRFYPTRLRQREEILLTATLKQPAKLRCHTMCDDIVGTHRFAEVEIRAPITWFPSPAGSQAVLFERPRLGPSRPKSQDENDFDADDLDDADLLAAARQTLTPNQNDVDDINDFVSDHEDEKRPMRPRKRSRSDADETEHHFREPRQLPNGNWTCQHACSDLGKQCKHKCCEDGVKKRLNRPTGKKLKKADKADASQNDVKTSTKGSPLARLSNEIGLFDSTVRSQNPLSLGTGEETPPGRLRDAPSMPPAARCHTSSSMQSPNIALAQSEISQVLPKDNGDTFDIDRFDWQAMYNVAAAYDQSEKNAEPLAAGEYKPMDRSHQEQINTYPKRLVEIPCGNTLSDQQAKVLMGASSHINYDTSGGFQGQQDFRPLAEEPALVATNETLSLQTTNRPGSCDDGARIQAQPDIHHASNTQTNNHPPQPDMELDKERKWSEKAEEIQVEDQKRRWSMLNPGRFTYEEWGQYITIVDKLPDGTDF